MAAILEKNRSKIMSSIKSKNTKIELILRKSLWLEGLRFRIHYGLSDKPDIVFPKEKIAIFVDGDFWHGYNWKELGIIPKKEFWRNKIKNNIQRDKKNNLELEKRGWKVLRFWEHEVMGDANKLIMIIKRALRKI